MKKRVAINGFGRIGRIFFRNAFNEKGIEIVAINDLMSIEDAKYLLENDSVYGKYDKKVEIKAGKLCVAGKKISFYSEKEPNKLPWKRLRVDVVIEATGVFKDYDKASMHNIAGAKKVIITAPVKKRSTSGIESDTVLIEVNTERAKTCTITSNASCTTNAVGIPINILNEKLGIQNAMINTVHAYTASQNAVDGQSKKPSKRDGRAAAVNIIPSSTGAAVATTKVVKSLKDKFDGISLRVPVVSGSIADITFISKKKTTVEEVNKIMIDYAKKSKLFDVTDEDIVSTDIIGSKKVAIADLNMTRVKGTLVKILVWYDNECGYVSSLIEHVKKI